MLEFSLADSDKPADLLGSGLGGVDVGFASVNSISISGC